VTDHLQHTIHHRSWLLKLAIAKKVLFGLLLLTLSLISGYSWQHYDTVMHWAHQHLLTAEFGLVAWGLHVLLQQSEPTLKLVAQISGGYGVLILIAAAGVWYGYGWAYLLFTLLVGPMLPWEIRELWEHPSWETMTLLLINGLIFAFFCVETTKVWHQQRITAESPPSYRGE